jgi:hypothetical protein
VEPADREWSKQRPLNVVGHELRTRASTIRGLAAAGVTTALPVGPLEAIDLPEAIRDTWGGADAGIEIWAAW